MKTAVISRGNFAAILKIIRPDSSFFLNTVRFFCLSCHLTIRFTLSSFIQESGPIEQQNAGVNEEAPQPSQKEIGEDVMSNH